MGRGREKGLSVGIKVGLYGGEDEDVMVQYKVTAGSFGH